MRVINIDDVMDVTGKKLLAVLYNMGKLTIFDMT